MNNFQFLLDLGAILAFLLVCLLFEPEARDHHAAVNAPKIKYSEKNEEEGESANFVNFRENDIHRC